MCPVRSVTYVSSRSRVQPTHSLPKKRGSVTYVPGTICYLCLESLIDPALWLRDLHLAQRHGRAPVD
jgi:hypothetical protein